MRLTLEQRLKRAGEVVGFRGVPTCYVLGKHKLLILRKVLCRPPWILQTLAKRSLKRRIGASKNLKERPATQITTAR